MSTLKVLIFSLFLPGLYEQCFVTTVAVVSVCTLKTENLAQGQRAHYVNWECATSVSRREGVNMLIQASVKLPPASDNCCTTYPALSAPPPSLLHPHLVIFPSWSLSFLICLAATFFISLSENLGSRSKIKVPTTGLNWPQLMLLITRYRVTNLSLSLWVWFCFVEVLIIWIITWAHFICKIYMKCSYIPVLGQCWWSCTLQPDEMKDMFYISRCISGSIDPSAINTTYL